MNYFTEGEMDFDADSANLQAAIGLKTCRDVSSVCGIFDDIREHERRLRGIDFTFKTPVQALSSDDMHQDALRVDVIVATHILSCATIESICNLLVEVRKHEGTLINRNESRWNAVIRAVFFLVGAGLGIFSQIRMSGV